MHRKLPSKFSHRAPPQSARLISHSFTSDEAAEVGTGSAKGQAEKKMYFIKREQQKMHKIIIFNMSRVLIL